MAGDSGAVWRIEPSPNQPGTPWSASDVAGNTNGIADDASRCAWLSRVGRGWSGLKEAFCSEQGHGMLVLDHDSLAQRPREVVELIYGFLGEAAFAHDFDRLEFDTPDYDEGIGLRGLHKVRQRVDFQARPTILPPDLFQQYSQLSFWKDTASSRANVIMIRDGE